MQYVDQFAALLYQTYRSVKNVNNVGDVYMGGLLWPYGAPKYPTPALATAYVGQYLTAIYNSLKKLGITIIPWDAINVHVHHCGFSQGDMVNLRQAIDQARAAARDSTTKRVIVGEWGVTHTEQSNNPGTCIQNAFTSITSQFDAMWYFQHSNNPPSACDQMDTPTQEYFGAIQWDVHAPPPGGPYQIFYKVPHDATWDDLVIVWS